MKEHLNDKQQQQLAFFLAGRCEQPMLEPLSGHYRPALLAKYADLTALRYDFPVILNENGPGDRAILSLSAVVDEAVASLADGADQDRVARHGHRLEQKIRQELPNQGSASLATIWRSAAEFLSKDDDTLMSSAKTLWDAIDAAGSIIDANADLPVRVVKHAWGVVQRQKARDFGQKAERLLFKLREILTAEDLGREPGRTPERLRSGVGTAFSNTFDFQAFSRILGDARPESRLSDDRRRRIRSLIEVIEGQRFYPVGPSRDAFIFEFQTCSEALAAYNDRYNEGVKLLRALAVADLEVSGDYREEVHDVIFDAFGQNGLRPDELAKLPDYLICTNASQLDAGESSEIVEIMAAGLPFRILVSTDDVFAAPKISGAHMPVAFRSRQLVDTAIGLSDVFVLQTPASDLYHSRDSLMRAASYDGPVLFSIFSGANVFMGDTPPYLVAAAAHEARVFPTVFYDPSAGDELPLRLTIESNPEVENDWPVHSFMFEDSDLHAHSVDIVFTLADLMAMDSRFASHFALLPDASWSDPFVSVLEALDVHMSGLPTDLPMIHLVDENGRLYRALVDEPILNMVRLSRTKWRILRQRDTRFPIAPTDGATLEAPPAPAVEELVESQAVEPDPTDVDEPYIETPRCTTCNECTGINSKMFAYNGNKQAYIADPDAGTYRELVEAAESCQVSIIHPGKPRNAKEPGLEDLVKRAAAFN